MPLPQPVPLDFPLRGLDTSVAAGLQKPLTTPLGTNARSQDPLARRVRGGSRTGLTRYIDARVNGVNPVQDLNFVITQDADATLYAADQTAAGPRMLDPGTSNFPNGPGATGPGGGPDAPTVPPFAAGFNRRHSDSATVPQGGSGVMQVRTTTSSPPPPPATLTRTYTPFADMHSVEVVGVFAIGPKGVPLTPPTDLTGDTNPVDYYGSAFNVSFPAWMGTGLPTTAQVNAAFVAAGWSSGTHPSGPYESSADT